MNKLGKLQYRALVLVYNDFGSSYEELLQRSNLLTLHIHRIRAIENEVFKMLNKMSPAYIQDLVQLKITKYSFRYENLVNVSRVYISGY